MKLFSDNKLSISTESMNQESYMSEIWSGVHTSTVFRSLVAQSLNLYEKYVPQLLEKNESPYLLLFADVTKLELISANDIEWLTNEVNPRYKELGFTHQAVIQPKSQIAQKNVSKYEGNIDGFETRIFNNDLDARRWFNDYL